MHEENRRMVSQVEQVNNAIEAYRDAFTKSRESVENDLSFEQREQLLKYFENPYIECVLLFQKDEEIHPETFNFIRSRGLELVPCSEEEMFYRAIPKGIDAYKMLGRLINY